RWLDLRWDVDDMTPQRFPARIALETVNEPGSLAQVAQVIAEHDGNIDNIHMERQSPDFTSVTIDLEVYDIKHLTSIIAQLRAKNGGASAERVTACRFPAVTHKHHEASRGCDSRHSSRRQRRPRRDHPQRARRAASRSGAGCARRDRGWGRRD